MTERLYHEIQCQTLTKMGPCNCAPVIVADGETAGDPGLRTALAALIAEWREHARVERERSEGEAQREIDLLEQSADTWELAADAVDALLARATPPPADSWQPIETAPKDGSRILVYQPPNMWRRHPASTGEREEFIQVVYWHQPGNPERNGFWTPTIRPTHWMPLPDPPLARATPRAPQQEEP